MLLEVYPSCASSVELLSVTSWKQTRNSADMVITAQEGNSHFLIICQFCPSAKWFSFCTFFHYTARMGHCRRKELGCSPRNSHISIEGIIFIGKIVKTESPHRLFVPQLLEQAVVPNFIFLITNQPFVLTVISLWTCCSFGDCICCSMIALCRLVFVPPDCSLLVQGTS